MRDPRLVEIEFLSALERERPTSIVPWDWERRLGVSQDDLRDMVFELFRSGCLDATSTVHPPHHGGTSLAPPDEALGSWGADELQRCVRDVLANKPFSAYLNHAGRLRLHRLKDEIFKARIKGSFDLGWDKRHWKTDLIVKLAMKLPSTPAAVLFIDADKFKDVNDKVGHTVGDEIITIILRSTLTMGGGAGGEVYHWGGDEVAVYLEGLEPDGCVAVAEAIRADIEKACALHGALKAKGVTATVSIGAFSFTGRPEPIDLTARVSATMKEAKAAGRNRVVPATFDFAIKREG